MTKKKMPMISDEVSALRCQVVTPHTPTAMARSVQMVMNSRWKDFRDIILPPHVDVVEVLQGGQGHHDHEENHTEYENPVDDLLFVAEVHEKARDK